MYWDRIDVGYQPLDEPAFIVTHPLLSSIFNLDDTLVVRWQMLPVQTPVSTSVAQPDRVVIHLFQDARLITTMAYSAPNNGVFQWPVYYPAPITLDAMYHVRVCSQADPHICGRSPGFRIVYGQLRTPMPP
eukprot:TRINITY_DN3337_c0_g1_i1.p1 TRINITY_DN3337_c0_g1~~TRINITY_DN3337_c0_g1_i1.p1  ORF type:complete len:131 (-),score=8.78 TRINITY_DN3337_c0_g1_i1:174-566(-)